MCILAGKNVNGKATFGEKKKWAVSQKLILRYTTKTNGNIYPNEDPKQNVHTSKHWEKFKYPPVCIYRQITVYQYNRITFSNGKGQTCYMEDGLQNHMK